MRWNPLAQLTQTKSSLSEQDTRRGVFHLTADGVCTMSMAAVQGGPFLPAFVLALGGTHYEIGLLASIGFLSQFMQLVGLALVQKFPKRRAITVLTAALSRLLWVFIVLVPVLFLDKGVTFLFQWLFLSALIGGIPGPAWNSLLRDIVPQESMGKILSKRILLGTTCALVLTALGGYFLDFWKTTFPDSGLYGYSVLFGLGVLFGLLGIGAIWQLPEPTMKVDRGISFQKLLVEPFKDIRFRGLLVFVAVWNLAVNLAGPFFIVYMLDRLKLSMFMVTILTILSQVTHIVFLRIWGRLVDQFSNKSVMGISGMLFLLAILG